MYQILIIASYDSFLRSGIALGRKINHSNIEIGILHVKNNKLSYRQLQESHGLEYKILDLSLLSDSDYYKYDIIIASIGNVAFRKFMREFYVRFSNKKNRPIVISVFPGVIFGHLESICSRINSDIIIANCKYDFDRINKISSLYNLNVLAVNYGLVNINESSKFEKRGYEKNIYFIDQVKIPASRSEREYVLAKLVELAKKNPEKNIIIKPRIYKGEKTVHDDMYSYFELFSNLVDPPCNIMFSRLDINDVFLDMDLCISFSSSVILEAAYHDIPIAVINDLGVDEKYFTDAFLDSGVLISFDNLIAGERPSGVNLNWASKYLSFDRGRNLVLNKLIASYIKDKPNISQEQLLFAGLFQFFDKQNLNERKFRKFRKLLRSPGAFFKDSIMFNYINKKFNLLK
ncbi:DUF6716 putative glycosyltransferase [Testudinibacter sp. P27/CKL/0425]